MSQSARLLDQVRQLIRLKLLSTSTEDSYLYFIRDYMLLYKKPSPRNGRF